MPTRSQAADAVEEALKAQVAVYREDEDEDTRARGEAMVLTSWVGVSAWAGMDADGDTSRLVLHLRDGQLPQWQIIGLLRSMLVQMEATYANLEREP